MTTADLMMDGFGFSAVAIHPPVVETNLFIGIDPGLSGYVAAIGATGYGIEWAIPIPTIKAGKSKRKYDLPGLFDILSKIPRGAHVQVEKQQAYPNQGAVSNFTTGYGFGIIEAMLTACRLPFETSHPKTWKGKMGLKVKPPEGVTWSQNDRTKANKQKSIEVGQRLFPEVDFRPSPRHRVPSSDYVEAVLLALYGRRFSD